MCATLETGAQMKRRLRKKLHVGEFCEYGVQFDLKITSSMSESAFDALLESFVDEYVERNGWCCGGGWNPKDQTAGMVVEIGRDREIWAGCSNGIEERTQEQGSGVRLDRLSDRSVVPGADAPSSGCSAGIGPGVDAG